MKKYFLTFASSNMSYERILEEAKIAGIFDECIGMSELDLPEEYQQLLKNRINKYGPQGYAYWCWKSYIINDLLNKIEDNDIIFFSDCGCSISSTDDVEKINHCINELDNTDMICIYQTNNTNDCNYTNKKLSDKIFELLNTPVNIELLKEPQVISGNIYVKKTKKSLEVTNWWKTICNDYFELTTDINNTDNYPEYERNLHDQSALSVISKIYNIKLLPDNYLITYTHLRFGHKLLNAMFHTRGMDNNTLLLSNYYGKEIKTYICAHTDVEDIYDNFYINYEIINKYNINLNNRFENFKESLGMLYHMCYVFENKINDQDYICISQYKRVTPIYNIPYIKKDEVCVIEPLVSEITNYEQLKSCENIKFFNTMMAILKLTFPDYYDDAITVLNGHNIFWHNMFVISKEEYAKFFIWALTIYDTFFKYFNFTCDEDIKQYIINHPEEFKNTSIDRNIRLDVFLERLLGIYMVHNFKGKIHLIGFYNIKQS